MTTNDPDAALSMMAPSIVCCTALQIRNLILALQPTCDCLLSITSPLRMRCPSLTLPRVFRAPISHSMAGSGSPHPRLVLRLCVAPPGSDSGFGRYCPTPSGFLSAAPQRPPVLDTYDRL